PPVVGYDTNRHGESGRWRRDPDGGRARWHRLVARDVSPYHVVGRVRHLDPGVVLLAPGERVHLVLSGLQRHLGGDLETTDMQRKVEEDRAAGVLHSEVCLAAGREVKRHWIRGQVRDRNGEGDGGGRRVGRAVRLDGDLDLGRYGGQRRRGEGRQVAGVVDGSRF